MHDSHAGISLSLYGQKFLVRTDHASLRWLLNFKEPEGMVARWLNVLANYDLEVQHRQGNHHANADALSRWPKTKHHKCKRPDCPDCVPPEEHMESDMKGGIP